MKIEYDYIPQKVYVGRFQIKGFADDCGFVTCKYKEHKWTGENIFSRLTGGYLPHAQRNAEVELNKAIMASVGDFDNVPTYGFKLLTTYDYNVHNIYNIYEFRNSRNVLIQDPRGFVFAISSHELFDLLSINNVNIKDGVIAGKLCYAFIAYSSRAFLISEDDSTYNAVKADSDNIIMLSTSKAHVKSSKFVVGKVYRGDVNRVSPGLYMYLGKHDVYSSYLHEEAVMSKSYTQFEDGDHQYGFRRDLICKMRNVFYYLGDDNDSYAMKTPETYISKSNVSKMFFELDKEVDLTKLHMKDCPGSDCTYESICNDMKHNIMFHKLDFSANAKLVRIPFEMFSLMFDKTSTSDDNISEDLRFFPYWRYSSTYFYTKDRNLAYISQMPDKHSYGMTNRYRVVQLCYDKIKDALDARANRSSSIYYSSYYHNGNVWTDYVNADFSSFKDFYDAVQPCMAEMKLDNGETVKAEQCFFLAEKTISFGV